jgi:hypothetical protein
LLDRRGSVFDRHDADRIHGAGQDSTTGADPRLRPEREGNRRRPGPGSIRKASPTTCPRSGCAGSSTGRTGATR